MKADLPFLSNIIRHQVEGMIDDERTSGKPRAQ